MEVNDTDLTPPSPPSMTAIQPSYNIHKTMDVNHQETNVSKTPPIAKETNEIVFSQSENLVDQILVYQQNYSREIILSTCLLLCCEGTGRRFLSDIVMKDICVNILQATAKSSQYGTKIARLQLLYGEIIKRLIPLVTFPVLDNLVCIEIYHAEAVRIVSSDVWSYEDIASVVLAEKSITKDIDSLVIDAVLKSTDTAFRVSLLSSYMHSIKHVYHCEKTFDISKALEMMRKHSWPEYMIRTAISAWAIEYRNYLLISDDDSASE